MPKIIIGVGGTGTRIIREISDRWDATGQRPRGVALAVIDAYDSTPENGDIANAIFYPNNPINFGNEFNNFETNIAPWWPRGVTPVNWVSFSDGCGAMRPYGRFFAFYFAAKIKRTIEEATSSLVLKQLGNTSGHALSFSIIIVGSLGNGTGGGIMLDVAAVARQQLSYVTKQITCLGIFIPSSVTRSGNTGLLAKRVAASGFASLLELQCEFNRVDDTADLRPKEPYKFTGWSGVDFVDFRPGEHDELSMPYDAVLLLDRRDRRGLEADYPTLVNIASEGISMLAEGGDSDNRLVDAFTMSAGGAKRFGSLGAARLTIPGQAMLDYCAAVHGKSALDLARATKPKAELWSDLLADETPGDEKKKRLKPEDATIEDSVDFFIENIIRIKETERKKARGGKTFNQLFDRFDTDDSRTLKEFEDLSDDLTALKDPKAIYNRAQQIGQFVNERVNALQRRTSTLTAEGEGSLWSRKQNPENPLDVGVKWLINERVLEFVKAGAFGLLLAWLDEFILQLKDNVDSITNNEREEHLRDKGNKAIDLDPAIAKLGEISDSMLASLRRKSLLEQIGLVRQNGTAKLLYYLWDTKAAAVEEFYTVVESHIEHLHRAAKNICDRLGAPQFLNRFDSQKNTAETILNSKQSRDELDTRKKQILAESFLGGDTEMRKSVLESLHGSDATTETEVLTQLADQNLRLYGDRLGSDAAGLGLQNLRENLPADAQVLYNEYRSAVEKTVRTIIEPVVAERCSIDAIFEAQASKLATAYEDARAEKGARVNEKRIAAVRRQLDDYCGPRIRQRIENLDWEGEGKAHEQSIDFLIAGRLQMVAQWATPQWSLAENAQQTKWITKHCFVTYPTSAERVANAIRYAVSNGLNDEVQLKAQADDFASPNRVDLVFVELGADLSALRTEQEFDDYRWAMTEEKGFSPHITRQYHDAGLKYLAKSGFQLQPGAAILALAEEYGIVEADRVGNYKLKIPIKQKREKQKVVYPGYAQGQMVGERGLENVVRGLDSGKGEKQQMLGGLRDAVFAAMTQEAHEVPENGWEKVADRVGVAAARLRALAQKESDGNVCDILSRQSDTLDALSAEIAESRGRNVPAMFA